MDSNVNVMHDEHNDLVQHAKQLHESDTVDANIDFKLKGIACCVITIGIVSGLCFGIASILISISNTNNSCVEKFSGISFNYLQWLYIFGIIQLAWIVLLCVIGFFWFVVKIDLMFLCHIMNLFNFAWYIVGSILFFEEVAKTCQGCQLYNYGLTLFILQTIGFVATGCTLSKKK